MAKAETDGKTNDVATNTQISNNLDSENYAATAKGGTPDHGFLGNQIRERAGSTFSKQIFDNYWRGGGDFSISASRFESIVKASKGLPGTNYPANLTSGRIGTARVISFYQSSEYALALGTSTIFYNNKGQPVGFYDYYDFDSKKWGTRSTSNELKTRAVDAAGSIHGAIPFSISYGIIGEK